MERRKFIHGAGIAGVLAAGAAPAVHAQQAIRWRLASSFPKSLDTIYGAAEDMAKIVTAATGGKFQITVAAAGELMPAFGVVDGVHYLTLGRTGASGDTFDTSASLHHINHVHVRRDRVVMAMLPVGSIYGVDAVT